jgi:DNA polymerase III subunit delta
MKRKLSDLLAFIARPDPGVAALLITGEDVGAVATRRADAVLALTGPQAEADMRLTRLNGADLRSDPAFLTDAIKATGFFPGPRAVIVDAATDGVAPAFAAALAEWQPGDAVIVAGAGDLKPKGALRKLIEEARNGWSVTLYADPPSTAEIADLCAKAGIGALTPDARANLADWAAHLDQGAFRRLVDTLGLYKRDDPTPLNLAEIVSLAPPQQDGDSDQLLAVVAMGQVAQIAPQLSRVTAQGIGASKLCIDGLRHFRTLLALATDPAGPSQAAQRTRPPIPYSRQDSMVRQAQDMGRDRLEKALAILLDTDMTLRSSSQAPNYALVERAFIRIAMSRSR